MSNVITNTVLSFLKTGRVTKVSTGGWISGNSPCCHHRGERPDSRKRGGLKISGDGFVWHCFNCGFKAGWQPGKLFSKNTKDLLSWLGMSENEINKLSFEALKEKDSIPTNELKFDLELQEVSLPNDCYPIDQWIKEGCEDQELINIIDYIFNRGLTLDDFQWHWSPENGYKDRVIIPFFYEGKIVGWTGRKISKGKPKYLSSSQKSYVFNIDSQTPDKKFAIVTEGNFDAISIGGIAIMHNDPNSEQCARINSLSKEIIVVPDRDKAGSKLLAAALNNNWNVSCPPWESHIKDVADAVKYYGKIYTLATILHYKESNKIKIELLRKKLEGLNV